MNKNLNTAAKLAALAGAFALAGCAFVPDTVHPQYVPQANVQKIPGADKVAVQVIVKNEKKHKDEISVTKDGYGIKMSGVYMHVAKDFKVAIDKALQVRGFRIVPNGKTRVDVVVQHFFLPEHMHLWSETHDGNLNMSVKVKNLFGKVVYSRTIIINNFKKNHNSGLFSNPTSVGRSASANGLLADGVNKLVNDQRFLHALLASGQIAALRQLP